MAKPAKPSKAAKTFEKIAKADTSELPASATTTEGFEALITATADQRQAANRDKS